MDILSAFALVIGVGLVVMSVAAWRGRLDLFPDSIRLNHTGVLASTGMFCIASGSINLYTQFVGLPLGPSLLVIFAVWVGFAALSIYMYLATPSRLMSRMSWTSSASHLPDITGSDPFDMDIDDLHGENTDEYAPLTEPKNKTKSDVSSSEDATQVKPKIAVTNRNIQDLAEVSDVKILELVASLAPEYRLDVVEPFKPQAVAWNILNSSSSSSFKSLDIDLLDGQAILEGAVWWDWDIQHVGDLEYVWVVYEKSTGKPAACYATASGKVRLMHLNAGPYVLYCEPGKHGHASSAADFNVSNEDILHMCNSLAEGDNNALSPRVTLSDKDKEKVAEHLRSKFFDPTFNFSDSISLRTVQATTWESLQSFIPTRIAQILSAI